MNESEFNSKLTDLIQARGGEGGVTTEHAALEQFAADVKSRHDTVQNTVSELEEAIEYLRLSVKYLVFDLEATRRENGVLRGLIVQRLECEEGETEEE